MIEETLCPECGSKMVTKKNKNDGRRFWGCPNFPKCKGTRDSEGKSKQDREMERIENGE